MVTLEEEPMLTIHLTACMCENEGKIPFYVLDAHRARVDVTPLRTVNSECTVLKETHTLMER